MKQLKAYEIAKELINGWNKISNLNKKYKIMIPQICICSKTEYSKQIDKNVNYENIRHLTEETDIEESEWLIVEDYLFGTFQKWNSNSGWVGDSYSSVQAFCHWTFDFTNGNVLFCDAQGIRTNDEYIITDPCILSTKKVSSICFCFLCFAVYAH